MGHRLPRVQSQFSQQITVLLTRGMVWDEHLSIDPAS